MTKYLRLNYFKIAKNYHLGSGGLGRDGSFGARAKEFHNFVFLDSLGQILGCLALAILPNTTDEKIRNEAHFFQTGYQVPAAIFRQLTKKWVLIPLCICWASPLKMRKYGALLSPGSGRIFLPAPSTKRFK